MLVLQEDSIFLLAFSKKSDRLLNKNGRLCLITSNKYLTANYGVGIREYLSRTGHVRKLVDLYDTKFLELLFCQQSLCVKIVKMIIVVWIILE